MVSQLSNVALLAVGPLAEWFGLNVPIYGFSTPAFLALVIFKINASRASRRRVGQGILWMERANRWPEKARGKKKTGQKPVFFV